VALGRESSKSRAALAELAQASKPDAGPEWIPVDLSSLRSVRDAAREFAQKHDRLDVLLNCAGVLFPTRRQTADGLEAMFATNYLSHFLLTNILFEPLRTGAPSRVITVSGNSHKARFRGLLRPASIDFDDLQSTRRFRFSAASRQAVLARILLTYELARRWRGHGIAVCTLCPGLARTDIARHMPAAVRVLLEAWHLVQGAQSAVQAGKHITELAAFRSPEEVAGRYFEGGRRGLFEARSSRASCDRDSAALLWRVSEELVGRRFRY